MKQAIGVLGIIFLTPLFAMLLWNGVGHTILGLKHIGYWQMLGIILLANFIFNWHPGKAISEKDKK